MVPDWEGAWGCEAADGPRSEAFLLGRSGARPQHPAAVGAQERLGRARDAYLRGLAHPQVGAGAAVLAHKPACVLGREQLHVGLARGAAVGAQRQEGRAHIIL